MRNSFNFDLNTPTAMSIFIVLRGTIWHSTQGKLFRLSPDAPDCCETICDEVEVNEPFVTLKTKGANDIFVQASDIVLMREQKVELPPGSELPPTTDSD